MPVWGRGGRGREVWGGGGGLRAARLFETFYGNGLGYRTRKASSMTMVVPFRLCIYLSDSAPPYAIFQIRYIFSVGAVYFLRCSCALGSPQSHYVCISSLY